MEPLDPHDNRWLASGARRGADYDRRFDDLARSGHDVHGEAALVLSLGAACVLDAGSGTGRVAIELARHGITTVGVDIDPAMLAEARAKAPDLEWVQADLASVALTGPEGHTRRFDVVLLAGNVMIFLAPGSEGAVVANLARHLSPGGRLVAGFQLGGNQLELAAYDQLAARAGLALVDRWSTWNRDPWTRSARYAVSVHQLG